MPTLTGAELTSAYFLQKEMFADSARNADYVAEVNAAKAVVENTTAKLIPLSNPNKKQGVRIYWNKFCNDDVEVVTEPDFCEPSGTQADAGYKDYEIESFAHKSFTIDEALYETSNLNMAEVFADNMLKTKKALDEKISQVLISKIDSFTSPNLYTSAPGCPGVVSPQSFAQTYIAPHLWGPELMNYFRNVARINKFSSPFLLDGKNLNAHAWLAMMNAANANGSGHNKMMQTIKYYEDLVNVEAVSPGKTFLIDRGSLAFVSRSRWTGRSASNPIEEKFRRKYSEPSQNIPGLTYDVYITETCSGPYTKYDVTVHAMYDLFNGAENCNNGTGVLEFVCGNCPS